VLRCVQDVVVDIEVQPLRFDEFFASEYPRLVPALHALTGDRQHAEDLAQDAFFRAHQRWDDIGQYDDPSAWVRRVALNATRNRWRRGRRERAALSRVPVEAVAPDAGDLPDAELWEAVRALPHQQQWAAVLHYVADLPVVEVAAALGCSEGSVKTHLSRARASLASHLTERKPDDG
jgi:RNA polymerase sigma-70 factor (ECF subfamily)